TDPWTEVDGERASVKTKHSLFNDPAVRQAICLLIDRTSIEKFIYGRTGVATANFVNNPDRFRSKNTRFEFSIEKANAILDAAARSADFPEPVLVVGDGEQGKQMAGAQCFALAKQGI